MPNRILKESIRTSKKVNALSDFQFRMWAYLITYADDYGRGSADAELIKGIVFPRRRGITESQIKEAFASMASIGIVNLYEVDGEPYFYFPNWDVHQTVRAKKSKFPAPTDASRCSAFANNCMQMQADVTVIQSNPIQSNTESNTLYVGKPTTQPRFIKPTFDEVAAYCTERHNGIDAQSFIDFYEARGWKLNRGVPMKDWKAAVRTWERHDREKQQQDFRRKDKYASEAYEQHTVTMDSLKDAIVDLGEDEI